MSDPRMQARVNDVKRWLLRGFRETLRGQFLTSEIQRWLNGEVGSTYTFEAAPRVVLDERTLNFIRDPVNRAKLDAERLIGDGDAQSHPA